jgi:hypothetical protein
MEPITHLELRKLVARFAESFRRYDAVPDMPAYLTEMTRAIEARQYTPPVVKEGLRRLIESEDWLPSIAAVLKSCAGVHDEGAARHP